MLKQAKSTLSTFNSDKSIILCCSAFFSKVLCGSGHHRGEGSAPWRSSQTGEALKPGTGRHNQPGSAENVFYIFKGLQKNKKDRKGEGWKKEGKIMQQRP